MMAESTSSSEVRGELSCSVCLERFQEPKVLPCCHSFCLKCLEGTLHRAKDKTNLTCPQCRTQHKVPPNGAQGFLNDYTLGQGDKDTSPPLKPTCQQCEENSEAVAYCNTCSEYVCEECLRAHKRMKAYRGHETVGLSSNQPTLKQKKRVYYCTVHPHEQLKLFCKTCQSLACIDCFIASHNGHDIGNTDDKTRKAVEKTITLLVRKTESKLKECEGNFEYISTVEKVKNNELGPLKAEINAKINSLVAELEARRTKLLTEADDMFATALKQLWAEKEHQETAIVGMKAALSFTRRSLSCEEDCELLALSAQITTRLKELSQQTWGGQAVAKIDTTKAVLKPPPRLGMGGLQLDGGGVIDLGGIPVHRANSDLRITGKLKIY